jgi:hypothetical protein
MTYREVFNAYVRKMTRTTISFPNAVSKRRAIIPCLGLTAFIIWVFIVLKGDHGILWPFNLLLVFAIGLIILSFWIRKFDRLTLIKKYNKIDFTDIEYDLPQIIDRIQAKMLSDFLEERVKNLEYINNLIEYSNEKVEETKIGFKLQNLGIWLVILTAILNQYISTLFNNWKTEPLDMVSKKTGLLLFIVAACTFLYITSKSFYFTIISDHQHHKDLSSLLKDIKTIILEDKKAAQSLVAISFSES